MAAINRERFWISRARRLALLHNLARWLDFFLPTVVVTSVAAAAALLVLRDLRADPPWFWSAFWVALALAAVGSMFFLRGRALGLPGALLRLDEQGRLHNRLTAARAGVGAWPEPQNVRDAVQPRWARVVTPGALSATLLAASAWVPLPEHEARFTPHEKPLAWSQVQSWIETLAQAKTVEPAALEKLGHQLNELQQQPAEKWFQQSSLEAGDSLRSQTQQALQNLRRDLHDSEKAVAAAETLAGHAQPEQLRQLEGKLAQAMEGLGTGQLPLNQELLKQLKDFQPGQVRQLSKDQLDELRERLQQGQKVCEKCVGPNRQAGDEGETGEQGEGGDGGGGREAPLKFSHEPKSTDGKLVENLQSNDLSHALPADLQAITAGEHEVKKEIPAGPIAGGEIGSTGQGGDIVWRNSILPAERAVLQKFFK